MEQATAMFVASMEKVEKSRDMNPSKMGKILDKG